MGMLTNHDPTNHDPTTGDPTTGDPTTDDPTTDDPTTDDHGQVAVLMLAVVGLVVASALGVQAVVATVVAQARAQSAADAAALRAVVVGCADLGEVLDMAPARLVSCEVDGLDAVVVVEVAGRSATARASRSPRSP